MNYEIRETEKLIDLIKNSSKCLKEYDKDLFKKVIDKILISKGEITFILKNKLECREYRKGNWKWQPGDYLMDIDLMEQQLL